MRSSGTSAARIRSAIARASSSGDGNGLTVGSGPSARVGRSVFSAPPSLGTSRFASASTCGVER